MKQKVLVDVKIECECPDYIQRWHKDLLERAKAIEGWIQDFHSFIRDHKSQDLVCLSVDRVYEEQCSFCGREWETDEDGCPVCCSKAREEWEAQNKIVQEVAAPIPEDDELDRIYITDVLDDH